MKKRNIIIGIPVALLAITIILLALAPTILSGSWARNRIVTMVNQHLPGQLQVKDWSLGWFSEIQIKGITYDHRSQGLRAEVVEIRSSRNLIGLIPAYHKLGNIEVIEPVVYLDLAAGAERPDTKTGPVPKKPQPPQKDTPVSAGGLPPLSGKLKITNGTLYSVSAQGQNTVIAKDLSVVLDAASWEKPLKYRLLTKSGDGSGQLAGQGSLALSPDDPANLNTAVAYAMLKIENWELAELLELMAARSNTPVGEGRLSADLNLMGNPTDGLQVTGSLTIPKLQLRGGPLKSDRPVVEKIAVEMDAIQKKEALRLNRLTLQSSLANGTVSGMLAGPRKNLFNATATINLAQAFSQMPETLKLQEGTRLSGGDLNLSARVEITETGMIFDTDARIDRLKGVSNGKKLMWNKPVIFTAKGKKQPGGLALENFSLRSAFFNGNGSGDLNNMRLSFAADLDTALKELQKFIQIKQWDGSGKLQADLDLHAGTDGIRQANLTLSLDQFALKRNGRRVIDRQRIDANLSTGIRLAENQKSSRLTDLALAFSSRIGIGRLRAKQIEIHAADSRPELAGLVLDGEFNLQKIDILLRNLDLIAADIRMSGNSAFAASGSLKNNQIELREASSDTKNFVFRQANKTVKEPRLLLKTKGKIDLNSRSVHLAPVEIDTQPGKVRIPELIVSDWSDMLNTTKARATAGLDLAKATQAYGDFITLPEKTRVSGNAQIDLDLNVADPATLILLLNADLSPFKLTFGKQPAISEKNVKLAVDLRRNPDGKTYTLKKIHLDSQLLALSAVGSIIQSRNRNSVDLKGSITPNLALLSEFLAKEDAPKIEIAGKAQRSFQLKMVSLSPRWDNPLEKINFNGTLFVKTINAFGLNVAPSDVPIRVVDSVATVDLDASANDGRLKLQPTVDLLSDPFVLSFAEDTEMMKNVRITTAMAETLLALIHPSFQGTVIPGGDLNLFMQHFKWPLDKKRTDKISFAGNLRVNGLKMQAASMLIPLLDIAGVEGSVVEFDNQNIEFRARDGRIETSAIRMSVDDYRLTLQGSVGFDQTLAYTAQIPVTRRLVGRDGYKYLQGTTIDVPIRGTVASPKIDEQALKEVTASLVQQALQKAIERKAGELLEKLFQ